MKILIVRMYADCLNIKNYNCQEVGLAKALVRNGNICDIVLYTDKNESYEEDLFFDEDNKKIHIYYLRAKNILKNCFFEKRLYEIVNKYDKIQTSEYDQIANVKLKKVVGDKLVIYHGPYKSKYTKGYNKKCLVSDLYYLFHKNYKSTPCLAKSNLAAAFLKEKGFKNIKVVGVGLDTEKFEIKSENTNEILEKLKKKKENENLKYLLYIGRIEDRRNIVFLIEVFEKVLQSNENIRLILVGKGEKKYINKCFEFAKERKVFDKIIYIESIPQNELPELYKISDVFLLPTKYEIFGMVLLEAMYFGLPVVTTLNGGSSILIKNDIKNGYIYDNEQRCIELVNEILDDENDIRMIGKNARKVVKKKYTWEKIADKMLNEQ